MRMMTMMMTTMMVMIKYIDDDKVYHQSIVGWGDSNDHRPEKEQFCLNLLCHGDNDNDDNDDNDK